MAHLAAADYIPQANPLAQYLSHKAEIDAAVARVLSSTRYILGEETRLFETEFARYIGARYGVGVASGTDAVILALRACAVGAGDEVITTPHTAVATVAAIELSGAVPVLADIDPDTCLLDAACVEACITPKTKAVVPVHLFGQPAGMDRLGDLCRVHGLYLIEDCAQAHGASFGGRRVGTWGQIGCFSFYPTKNLGAIGDGGMVITDDVTLADRVRQLRQYGWKSRFVSEVPGQNSRLDELQAAILRVKLQHLDDDNRRRQQIAAKYTTELRSLVQVPAVAPGRTSVFHQYVVRLEQREFVQSLLHERSIGTAIHYPVPIHLQPAYRGRLGDVGSCPVAEAVAGEILSLPMYPELSDQQVEAVVSALVQCCNASLKAHV